MKRYAQDYGVSMVATTARQVTEPTRHTFGSSRLADDAQEDRFHREEPYRDIEVVDRVGSGDAYLAGALVRGCYSTRIVSELWNSATPCPQWKVQHPGDLPASDAEEIKMIIAAHRVEGAPE